MKMFKTQEQMRVKNSEQLFRYCCWLLERRDYSKSDLSAKMKKYAANPDDIPDVLLKLEGFNYVDDKRVAKSTLRSELNKGSGPKKIENKLKLKGLNKDYVSNEMNKVDWLEKAIELKIKKFGEAVEDDYKLKAKQVRFLMSRGFDYETSSKAIVFEGEYHKEN